MELTRPQKVLVALGLLVLLGGLVLLSLSHLSRAQTASVMTYTPPPSISQAQIAVHVVGAVRQPGLYWLPAGSRVADAITAAGGWTGDADAGSVNLAAVLVDGQQVPVGRIKPIDANLKPVPGSATAPETAAPPGVAAAAPPVGTSAAVAAPAPPATPLSLNQATLEQLDNLPGVGPELAKRILYYRYEHGGFRSVDELGNIEGIGPGRLLELRPLVRP